MDVILIAVVGLALAAIINSTSWAVEPIDIGSRLELFVDDHLVDQITGNAKLHLHRPTPREVVLVTDEPWEGNTSGYYTVFQDDDCYRMYYRGSHFDTETRKGAHPEVTCYAESRDGIHWAKPDLELFEFGGSKQNSIVWDGVGTHNFTPFRDTNPDCAPDARYKALGREKAKDKRGLFALKSGDGIHWSLMSDGPVITEGAFDSQNLAFWDATRRCYVDFHRGFRNGVRDIMTATSEDFLHWTVPVYLEYPGAPTEHLYTNAILAYDRAPHILLGFPTRYYPDRNEQVEPTFMVSRDGRAFHRWAEPLIPVTAPEDRTGNRSNYMAWGMVKLPDNDREYSMYATEAYYTGPDSRLRRFTYRVDGFVSLRAAEEVGELLTKPLTFAGQALAMNFETSGSGSLRVEIQDDAGEPIEGFALDDCPGVHGDEIEQVVTWGSGSDVSRLAGTPIRLRFVLQDADLYSIRFR